MINERYSFLHSELRENKWVTYKPITTNKLEKTLNMYKYFENENKKENNKVHEIAIFDYEKMVYVKNNFQLFRKEREF